MKSKKEFEKLIYTESKRFDGRYKTKNHKSKKDYKEKLIL